MAKLSAQYIHGLLRKMDGNSSRVKQLIEEFGFENPCSHEGHNMLYMLASEAKGNVFVTSLMESGLNSVGKVDEIVSLAVRDREIEGRSRVSKTCLWTPLAAAMQSGDAVAAKMLLSAGASPFVGFPPAWCFAFEVKGAEFVHEMLSDVLDKAGDELMPGHGCAIKDVVFGSVVLENRLDLLDLLPPDLSSTKFATIRGFRAFGPFILHGLGKQSPQHSTMFKKLSQRLPKDSVWLRDESGWSAFERFATQPLRQATAMWIVNEFGVPPPLPNGKSVLFGKKPAAENLFGEKKRDDVYFFARNLGANNLVRFLLDKGVEFGTLPNDVQFLHEACRFANVGLAKELLARGADPSLPNEDGRTAWEVVDRELSRLPNPETKEKIQGWKELASMLEVHRLKRGRSLSSGRRPSKPTC